MASSGKRKTTMAKLNRERKLAERRLEKKARKEARREAAANPQGPPDEAPGGYDGEQAGDAALHPSPLDPWLERSTP